MNDGFKRSYRSTYSCRSLVFIIPFESNIKLASRIIQPVLDSTLNYIRNNSRGELLMTNSDLVETPDTTIIKTCIECGRKIEEENIIDSDKSQFCFYCNRKKIQKF